MGWVWGEGQGEGVGRDSSDGAMGPEIVVFLAPVVDEQASFFQGAEPVLIEAVITEGAVEGLDEGILSRLAWLDMVQVDATILGPEMDGLAGELRSVVAGDGTGRSHRVANGIEHIDHGGTSDGGIHLDGQTLPGAVIDDIEAPEAPPSGKLVMDEVHGPTFIGTHGNGQGNPYQSRQLPAPLSAQGQSLLPVDPGSPLPVNDHPLGFEDVMEDGKPPSGLPGRPVAHPLADRPVRACRVAVLHRRSIPSGDPAETTLGEPKAGRCLLHGGSAGFGL